MKKTLLTVLIVSSLISAQAQGVLYSVDFSGPNESPANASPGIGTGTVYYDSTTHLLQMQATYSGLLGNVTQTHIHAPTVNPFTLTAAVAVGNTTLPGFALGSTSGSYSNTLDMTQTSIYNTGFLAANGGTAAGAEAAVAAAMAAGKSYWNIHTTSFGGGEVRGFLTLVPEPSRLMFAGLGLIGMVAQAWNKNRVRGD